MSTWAERAKARFSEALTTRTDKTDETRVANAERRQEGTDKTDESRVSAVSSVGVVALFKNTNLSRDLLSSAMQACDAHGDGPEAREQMRQEVLATPPDLWPDLLAHLQREYGGGPC